LVTLPLTQLDPIYRSPFLSALGEYRAAQQLDLERAHPHINLGWLDRQLNRQLDGGANTATPDLAWLKGAVGDKAAAADELRSAIRMEPYISGPRSELANLLSQNGGDEAEVRELREEEVKLLVRDATLLPNNGDIAYRLGLLEYQLGRLEEAETALKAACQLAPNDYDFRMTLALLQEKRYEQSAEESRYQAAKESLNQLLEMRPRDPRGAGILQRLESTHQAKRGTAGGDAP
jgi:tetratricopeptide (TPR) repeat protein